MADTVDWGMIPYYSEKLSDDEFSEKFGFSKTTPTPAVKIIDNISYDSTKATLICRYAIEETEFEPDPKLFKRYGKDRSTTYVELLRSAKGRWFTVSKRQLSRNSNSDWYGPSVEAVSVDAAKSLLLEYNQDAYREFFGADIEEA